MTLPALTNDGAGADRDGATGAVLEPMKAPSPIIVFDLVKPSWLQVIVPAPTAAQRPPRRRRDRSGDCLGALPSLAFFASKTRNCRYGRSRRLGCRGRSRADPMTAPDSILAPSM